MVLSLALGFLAGWGICRLVILVCAGMDRRKTNGFFQGAQIFAAAAMSFMHGAQDGQKFIGVLFLGMAFCGGQESVTGMVIPAWLMLMCSTVMGLGTSVGGEKIIKSVGMDMVRLEKYQGFAADLGQRLGGGGQPRPRAPALPPGGGGGGLPAALQPVRYPSVHHPHQDQRHHGCGGGEAALRHQFRRGEGHDAHLGVHLPGMRAHQLCHG